MTDPPTPLTGRGGFPLPLIGSASDGANPRQINQPPIRTVMGGPHKSVQGQTMNDKNKDRDENEEPRNDGTSKCSKWEAMTSRTNPAMDSWWAEQFSSPDYHGH